MGMTMIRKEVCDYDRNRTVETIVYDTVTYFRNLGYRREVPFEQAALALDMSQRKVWSIFYGQAWALLDGEIARLRHAFARHLDERADDLARRSEEARARRRQFELEI